MKGGLAIAQTATIVALLVVSYHTNSKWGDGEVVQARVSKVACGRPLEKWILASSVRLMVCWWISLWIVWRRGRLDTESRGSEEGGIGIERPPYNSHNSTFSTNSGQRLLGSTSSSSDATHTSEHGQRLRLADEEIATAPEVQSVVSPRSESWAKKMDGLAPKLSLACLLLSVALFISGNVFLWTSTDTCKLYSPLQWWAVMAVIGVGYVLIGEVVVIVLVVGIIGGPLVRMLASAGLVEGEERRTAFPRPPNPMSEAEVEELPVVLYVPGLKASEKDEEVSQAVPTSKSKFGRFKNRSTTTSLLPKTITPMLNYDRNAYDHPPHEIPPSHANCAICLVEFEEARPKGGGEGEGHQEGLRLRLLPCGHVYHAACLDHWLTRVSGRCPTCNRALRKDSTTPGS